MKVFPDVSGSGDRLSTLRRLLHARMNGELSDDEFATAIRSTCTQTEFVAALSAHLHAEPESVPRVIALLKRLNDRGDIPTDLVRLLEVKISEVKISRGEAPRANDGVTLDLSANGDLGRNGAVTDRHAILPQVEIGRVLRDRYEIQQRLGTGGKGTVFKALDRYRCSLPASQRYVAIKLLHECAGT